MELSLSSFLSVREKYLLQSGYPEMGIARGRGFYCISNFPASPGRPVVGQMLL
jgi:hypothetical protein